jgi:hypothetical protein
MATLIVVEDLAHPAVVGQGGHAMYVLQYLEGLRRLGHEVYFLEFLQEPPPSQAVSYFKEVTDGWWSRERAALLLEPRLESLSGIQPVDVQSIAEGADGLITLSAHFRREPWPLIDSVRPRVLVDSDPAYTHLWAAEEDDPADTYGEHDFYLTVGLKIGSRDCAVPALGLDWRPTLPPVVLDWWPPESSIVRDRFTTLTSWRDYGYLEFGGQVIGPKAEEFYHFIALPQMVGEPLELALVIDEDDPDVALLNEHGWVLEDPAIVWRPEHYIRYITESAGEFACAKGGYVRTHSGWFSDRSACYLAAGRPVVLQATGFEDLLPTGEGLFAVNSAEEAAEAIHRVRADYAHHSGAARELAREYLDSDVVLRRLLDQTGISS